MPLRIAVLRCPARRKATSKRMCSARSSADSARAVEMEQKDDPSRGRLPEWVRGVNRSRVDMAELEALASSA